MDHPVKPVEYIYKDEYPSSYIASAQWLVMMTLDARFVFKNYPASCQQDFPLCPLLSPACWTGKLLSSGAEFVSSSHLLVDIVL